MPQIEYLLVQKDQSEYKIRVPELTSDLPDTCKIDDLIQEATAAVRQLLSLDSSLPILVEVYTLRESIASFDDLSLEELITALGNINEDFFFKNVAYRSSNHKLSVLFPDQDEKRGKVLVVFSLPRPQHSLYSIQQEESVDKHISREKVVDAARKRSSPSTGAHNSTLLSTQQKGKADAIYNGQPIALTAPSIAIYHPVFATFQKKMATPVDDFTFSGDDLRQVHRFVINSLAFYTNKTIRTENLNLLLVHETILEPAKFTDASRSFVPDGCTRVTCKLFKTALRAVTSFTEIRNGIGESGSDPIHQAQCDYVTFYSAEAPLRDASCCPSFLIGIAGPYMIISGAVLADRFISQHLTDYIYLGGKPHLGDRLYEIAKVLAILKECIVELEHFYSGLPPVPIQSHRRSKPRFASSSSASPLFPHFRRFTTSDGSYELQYIKRLRPENPAKAVFKASARASGSDTISTVVVKFAVTYSQHGHQLLATQSLAPKLWFCEAVESVGMYVIVMDYVKGPCVDELSLIPLEACKAIGKAIGVLHVENLVFGDLRPPNAIICEDSAYTKGAVLIDFEWCGEEGKVFYPPDLNMETIKWHEGVCPGGKILHEHDLYMLDLMVRKGSSDDPDSN